MAALLGGFVLDYLTLNRADLPLVNVVLATYIGIAGLGILLANTPLRGRIDIHASMLDEKTVRIAVTDTGCGIADADREIIFEKFRQADGSLTRESTGSGLGLSICKELAAMLAGSIGLTSEVGTGSTFWLDIPVQLRAGGAEPPSEAANLNS